LHHGAEDRSSTTDHEIHQLHGGAAKIVLEVAMNVPVEYKNYLQSIGFEDFLEPFTVQCYGNEYEFLRSDEKEITDFPGWESITAACETAVGVDVCRVNRSLDDLKGLITSLHKDHGLYLRGFPPYKVWEMDNFRKQIELAFAQ
jgi:hypothetical protein